MNDTTGRETGSNPPKSSGTDRGSSWPVLFFVGMALLLITVVIIGFWPTYFGSVFLGQEATEWGIVEISPVTHVHAAVFAGWLLLLLIQTGLIATGRAATHMKLGVYGMALGVGVFLIGLLMSFTQIQTGVEEELAASWMQSFLKGWRGWFAMLQFAVLLGLGYVFRSRPEAHKRYMVFATITLVQAAHARWRLLIGEWSNEIMTLLVVAPMWIYDLWSDGRIHPATLIGTAVVGAFFLAPAVLG